jgi:hypothetical protein
MLTRDRRSLDAVATIDKHRLAGPDERLFRLLLAPGNAAVIDGLDAIAGLGVTTLSPGHGNA